MASTKIQQSLTAIGCLRTLAFTFAALQSLQAHSFGAKRQSSIVQNAIQESLEANKISPSHAEWESSGKSPRLLFQKLNEVAKTEGPHHVCQSLNALSTVELAVFEEFIDAAEFPFLASCESALKTKLETHYETDRRHFSQYILNEKRNSSEPASRLIHTAATADSNCPGNPNAMGTVRQIEIDTTGGPAYGAYRRHPSIPGLQDHELVITIDDGPHPTRTPRALDAFRNHCIKTTVFSVGVMAKANPKLLQQAYNEGHVIANHTWDHQYIPNISAAAGEKEITDGYEILKTVLAQIPSLGDPKSFARPAAFFRFPGGNETPAALAYLQKNNIASFTWDAGADDWLPITAEESYKRALQQIEQVKKGIFLVHDTQEKTVTMLPDLLNELARRGYKAVQIVPKASATPPGSFTPRFGSPNGVPIVILNAPFDGAKL